MYTWGLIKKQKHKLKKKSNFLCTIFTIHVTVSYVTCKVGDFVEDRYRIWMEMQTFYTMPHLHQVSFCEK